MLSVRPYRILLAGLILLAVPAYSQLVSVGVKGGVPLADPLNTGSGGHGGVSHSVLRYVVGVTGEVHLPLGLSIEADALYRRIVYDSTFYFTFVSGQQVVTSTSTSRTTGNDWQLPLLAKYQFKNLLVHPFVDAGLTYRHVSLSNQSLAHPNTAGFSVGGGVALRALLLRIAPEIRYTYFPTEVIGFQGNYTLSTTPNQLDFLIGLTF